MKGTTDFTLTLLYLLKPSFDYHWHVSCEKIGLLWSDLARIWPTVGNYLFVLFYSICVNFVLFFCRAYEKDKRAL